MKWGKNECELIMRLAYGIGPATAHKLLVGEAEYSQQHPDIRRVIPLDVETMRQLDGLSEKGAIKIRKALDHVINNHIIDQELELIEKHNAHLLTFWDLEYPPMLRNIRSAPRVLWVKGKITTRDYSAVGIVGARKCTQYGREQASRIAGQLADVGTTIISGGALGIDAASHQAALERGGRTIAIIGSGLAKPYPKDNIPVFRSICELERDDSTLAGGAVISEVPMNTAPRPELFPARNRIISGMSLATLIVEAAIKSGAMRTASHAIEQGRDLLALPGRVDSRVSAGCHQLIKDGLATIATSSADILDTIAQESLTLVGTEESLKRDADFYSIKIPAPQHLNPNDLPPNQQANIQSNQELECSDESVDSHTISNVTSTDSLATTTITAPATSSTTSSLDQTQSTVEKDQLIATTHSTEQSVLSNQRLDESANPITTHQAIRKVFTENEIVDTILKNLGTEGEARSFDELVALSKLTPEQVTAHIVPLEIRRQIVRRNGLYWKRTPKKQR
ncbi:DNA-protecting protein DprA [Planctomycetota bacterium]|nr:DNA-protecting protein DprA [Planctomycetota bacterium]